MWWLNNYDTAALDIKVCSFGFSALKWWAHIHQYSNLNRLIYCYFWFIDQCHHINYQVFVVAMALTADIWSNSLSNEAWLLSKCALYLLQAFTNWIGVEHDEHIWFLYVYELNSNISNSIQLFRSRLITQRSWGSFYLQSYLCLCYL